MRRALVFGIALIVVAIDRVSKAVTYELLSDGAPRQILGSSLQLIRSENRGGLFGLFQGSAPLLALLSLGVIAVLLLVHERERAQRPTVLTVATGLLVGGAAGNLWDRITIGYVFDFIDVGLGGLRFWTFNVADTAISLGIALVLFTALRTQRENHRVGR